MLKFGNNTIGDVYFGNSPIYKIYKGSELVYNKFKIPETDIALYDNVEKYEITVPTSKYNAIDYPTNRYIPVGIVVIPANISYELFDDNDDRKGKPIIMSLKYMDYDNPDNGGDPISIYFGGYQSDLSLNDFKSKARILNTNDEEVVTTNTQGTKLPSTKFASTECLAAPETYYQGTPYHPSPVKYNKENRKWVLNPQFKNAPDTCSCLDVNGKINTAIILENVTVNGWKTADTIINSYTSGNYPIACCCWRYHIEGVDNQGDWYLPSCGELCFIMPFFLQHQDALKKIIEVYDASSAVLLKVNSNHASSSEYDEYSICRVYTMNGLVEISSKGTGCSARAFRELHTKSI